jgi:WD40 repeat protein
LDLCFSPSEDGNPERGAENKPGEIKIWDLTLGQELLTLKGHTGCVRGVSFSPNGKVLASCSWGGTIRLWGDLTGMMR